MKPASGGFERLGSDSDGFLRRSARGEGALAWLNARWDRIVGEPLSRKIAPAALDGRRLLLDLLDPAWRKPVESLLPELERRLARELPKLKPTVRLR